jgi:hypothetical protein
MKNLQTTQVVDKWENSISKYLTMVDNKTLWKQNSLSKTMKEHVNKETAGKWENSIKAQDYIEYSV